MITAVVFKASFTDGSVEPEFLVLFLRAVEEHMVALSICCLIPRPPLLKLLDARWTSLHHSERCQDCKVWIQIHMKSASAL